MIIGLGIDAIEIDRFKQWHTYSPKKLSRVFAQEEIIYCLSEPVKSAERFAARFAAKEAFLKAVTSLTSQEILLLAFARRIWIKNDDQHKPELIVNWNFFLPSKYSIDIKTQVSLTHTKNLALATVILEQLS